MRQQMANGDCFFAVLSKLRQIRGHGGIWIQFALLNERHHTGRRCDGLCERRQIKHRIHRHGHFFWLQLAKPVSATKRNPFTATDNHDAPGHLVLFQPFLNDVVNQIQWSSIHADGFRFTQRDL